MSLLCPFTLTPFFPFFSRNKKPGRLAPPRPWKIGTPLAVACIATKAFPISSDSASALHSVAGRGSSTRLSLSTPGASSSVYLQGPRIPFEPPLVVRPVQGRTPVGVTRPVPPGHWPFSSTLATFGRVGPPVTPLSVSVRPCGLPVPFSDPDLAAGGFRVTGSSSYRHYRFVSKPRCPGLSTNRYPALHVNMTSS